MHLVLLPEYYQKVHAQIGSHRAFLKSIEILVEIIKSQEYNNAATRKVLQGEINREKEKRIDLNYSVAVHAWNKKIGSAATEAYYIRDRLVKEYNKKTDAMAEVIALLEK
jgi:hypothetical protein